MRSAPNGALRAASPQPASAIAHTAATSSAWWTTITRLPSAGEPRRPRRVALRPEVVELDRVLVGVHALPEAGVAKRVQLPVGGEALQRLALEPAQLSQLVNHPGLKDEDPAVDPVLRARLLAKPGHAAVVAVDLGHAELQLGPHDRHRRQRAVRVVEAEHRLQVDVREPVAIGRAEALLAHDVRQALDSAARGRLQPRVDAANGHTVRPVAALRERLDHLALVAAGQDDVAQAVARIQLHDVPDDRLAADLDQRLGDRLRVFLQPRPPAPAEDHHLHARKPSSCKPGAGLTNAATASTANSGSSGAR